MSKNYSLQRAYKNPMVPMTFLKKASEDMTLDWEIWDEQLITVAEINLYLMVFWCSLLSSHLKVRHLLTVTVL